MTRRFLPKISDLAGAKAWLAQGRLIPIVVASALFMDLMDSSALAMALPTVAKDFGIGAADLKIALTAYVVTVAVLVPASAWLASRFGARRVFLTAMTLFMLGSICCAMAQNLTELVCARVLQGIGGATMTPIGRFILVSSVPREDLVRGMAWYTLPAIFAPLVGPPIAGALIEYAEWRWIFFLNVPVGIVGIVAAIRFVPALAPTRAPAFDLAGFVLGGSSVLAIMGLLETRGLANVAVPLRLGVFAATALILMTYIRQALKASVPIADLRVLRHPTLRWSLISTWLHRVALGSFTFLLPLQLQLGLGYSPLVSSQVMIAAAVGSILSRFISPIGIRLAGFRNAMLLFGTLTAVLTLAPAAFGNGMPVIVMAAVMLCHSSIRASFFLTGNTLSYCDVQGEEIVHASTLFAISQQLSLGLGFTIAAEVLTAAGGPHEHSAFVWSYVLIAALPLLGTLAVRPLRANVGEDMRKHASA